MASYLLLKEFDAKFFSPAQDDRVRDWRWKAQDDRVSGSPRGYQMRQDLVGAMGAFGLQPKAGAKPGWLTMTPLTRKRSGEWGSWRTCERTDSGRAFWHQF